MYKILDTDSNTHVMFDSYIDACAFKGVDPKKAYKVKRNTKDRPKVFGTAILNQIAEQGLTKSYVSRWLSDNHLRA